MAKKRSSRQQKVSPAESLAGAESPPLDPADPADPVDHSVREEHPPEEVEEEEEGGELSKPEKNNALQCQGIFRLAYGFIQFSKLRVAKKDASQTKVAIPDDQSPLDDQDEEDAPIAEPAKTGGESVFRFIGRRCNKPIVLFGDQMFRLIDELPNAYQAYDRRDETYKHVLVENKSNRVTLEVSLYKDQAYLFLKRYFKSTADYRGGPSDDWIPTKGVVSLAPDRDHPADILNFVLSCC